MSWGDTETEQIGRKRINTSECLKKQRKGTVQHKGNTRAQIKEVTSLGLTVWSLSEWPTDQNFRCASTSIREHIGGNYRGHMEKHWWAGGSNAAELISPTRYHNTHHYRCTVTMSYHESAQSAWWSTWRFWLWRVMIWWYFKVKHLAVDGGQRVFGWEHLCYHVNIRIMGTAFMNALPQLFTEEELSSSKRATNGLNMVPTGAEKYIVWRLLTAWEKLFMPPVSYFGPYEDFPGLWHEWDQLPWENKLPNGLFQSPRGLTLKVTLGSSLRLTLVTILPVSSSTSKMLPL